MQKLSSPSITAQQWSDVAANWDVNANRERWLNGPLKDVVADDIRETWGKFHVAAHGTTVERALKIIADGEIAAHSALRTSRPEVVEQRLSNATDDLDIRLGLDKYVFLSMGRVHPNDLQDVYFIFRNEIAERPGTIVALREIVHFGAMVSPEAVLFHKRATGNWKLDADRVNFNAAREYFKNVFAGADFVNAVFPRFLQKHFENISHFSTARLYPGEEFKPLRVGREMSVNFWEGPQMQVPDRLSLGADRPSILVTTTDPSRIAAIEQSGFPRDRIYLMRDVVSTYKAEFPLREYEGQLDRGIYINLALRDLALLAHHNRSNQHYADSMTGFKRFAR